MEENKKTIAFRVWSIKEKRYYPNINHISDNIGLGVRVHIGSDTDKFDIIIDEDYTIEQYLDLFDMHYNQICESDILTSKMHFKNCTPTLQTIFIVDNRFPGMMPPILEPEEGKFLLLDMEKSLQAENLEIVGNIHEDPGAENAMKEFKRRFGGKAHKVKRETDGNR
jgi:hypothetical protein